MVYGWSLIQFRRVERAGRASRRELRTKVNAFVDITLSCKPYMMSSLVNLPARPFFPIMNWLRVRLNPYLVVSSYSMRLLEILLPSARCLFLLFFIVQMEAYK